MSGAVPKKVHVATTVQYEIEKELEERQEKRRKHCQRTDMTGMAGSREDNERKFVRKSRSLPWRRGRKTPGDCWMRAT